MWITYHYRKIILSYRLLYNHSLVHVSWLILRNRRIALRNRQMIEAINKNQVSELIKSHLIIWVITRKLELIVDRRYLINRCICARIDASFSCRTKLILVLLELTKQAAQTMFNLLDVQDYSGLQRLRRYLRQSQYCPQTRKVHQYFCGNIKINSSKKTYHLCTFKGNGYTFRGIHFCQNCCLPSEKVSTRKGKKLIPTEKGSTLAPFWKRVYSEKEEDLLWKERVCFSWEQILYF